MCTIQSLFYANAENQVMYDSHIGYCTALWNCSKKTSPNRNQINKKHIIAAKREPKPGQVGYDQDGGTVVKESTILEAHLLDSLSMKLEM